MADDSKTLTTNDCCDEGSVRYCARATREDLKRTCGFSARQQTNSSFDSLLILTSIDKENVCRRH